MIVGPTGGGKTVVLDTLKAARLKAEGVVVKYYVINPKAQPLNELYGVMDPVTRDWTDGPRRGVPALPSRHGRDSWPSHDAGGRFFCDFEANRDAPRRCPVETLPGA